MTSDGDRDLAIFKVRSSFVLLVTFQSFQWFQAAAVQMIHLNTIIASWSRCINPTVRHFWREFIKLSKLETDFSPILDDFQRIWGGRAGGWGKDKGKRIKDKGEPPERIREQPER
jgi:hypothetical protein